MSTLVSTFSIYSFYSLNVKKGGSRVLSESKLLRMYINNSFPVPGPDLNRRFRKCAIHKPQAAACDSEDRNRQPELRVLLVLFLYPYFVLVCF